MNIKRNTGDVEVPLFEASKKVSDLGLDDLISWMDDNFPNNATSWKDATDEIGAIKHWLCENLEQDDPRTKETNPGKRNKAIKDVILKLFPKLDKVQQTLFFEEYGHWMIASLNESEASMDNNQEKSIGDAIDQRSVHFHFDDGAFMLNMQIDNDTPYPRFGLRWHAENTVDETSFIESVSSFLSAANCTLSSNDQSRLSAHYQKYK